MNQKYKDHLFHIIAQVDGKYFKSVLMDGGLAISVVSSMVLGKLDLSLSHLKAPTLILHTFNNQLCNTLARIILPILLGSKTIRVYF